MAAESDLAQWKNEIENSGECGKDDDDDDDVVVTSAKSGNADEVFEIKIDDLPDQTDSHNNDNYSLGENDNGTKAHDSTSNDTNVNESGSQTSTNSFDDSEFILLTPIWARCSIQNTFYSLSISLLSPSLSLNLSQHFIHSINSFENRAQKFD